MPRPFSRNQILENRAFLKALRRTGNVRAAARTVGIHRATLTRRRAKHPPFAAEWDAVLALAHAALNSPSPPGEGLGVGPVDQPRPTRLANGRLQLRAPAKRRLTQAAEQAFLAALSATANVRLSAKAAGFSHSAFYQRRRESPSFAREMRLALQLGYDRLEETLLAGFEPEAHADDAWRHNDLPAIPPMTANQALQLLYLHQKEARLWTTPVPDRLRPGETWEARSVMLGMIHEAQMERQREKFRVAEAERRARGEPTWEDMLVGPPDLAQVTGWSKAKPHSASEADRETARARPADSAADPSDGLRNAQAACPERSPEASSRRAGLARAGPDPDNRAGFGRGGKFDEGRALFGGWRAKAVWEE